MGYDPDFIDGAHIPLPALSDSLAGTALNGGAPIDHTRFSIVFSQARHFALLTAHHIDGGAFLQAGQMPNRAFRFDPEISNDIQVDNDRGYRNNPWDRGHQVRRFSQHWGSPDEAATAVSESDYWSNIAPQHGGLHHSAWGHIENWMLSLTDDTNQRASIFTGPVNTPDDPEHVNQPGEEPIRIPAGFWKVMAIQHQGRLKASAFLTWQRDFGRDNPVVFDPILEQVRLTTIEYLTGFSFAALQATDPLRFERRDAGTRAAPAHPGEVTEIAVEFPRRSAAIASPADIFL